MYMLPMVTLFNPPPLSQVYRYTDVVRANPNLDPERSDTFEVGMKKNGAQKLH